jgi:hypothetical protein
MRVITGFALLPLLVALPTAAQDTMPPPAAMRDTTSSSLVDA